MPAVCLALGGTEWLLLASTALPTCLQVAEEAKLCQSCVHTVASDGCKGWQRNLQLIGIC